MLLNRVIAIIIASILCRAEVAGQGQYTHRKLHGAFLAGALLLEGQAHGVGGVEFEFGARGLRPTAGALFGRNTAALGIGLAWHGIELSPTDHCFFGAGASMHDIVTYRIYGRIGIEHSRNRDIGFRFEARTYALPLMPALLIGIVLPGSKS